VLILDSVKSPLLVILGEKKEEEVIESLQKEVGDTESRGLAVKSVEAVPPSEGDTKGGDIVLPSLNDGANTVGVVLSVPPTTVPDTATLTLPQGVLLCCPTLKDGRNE